MTLVSQKDLANILGITARQIRNLHSEQGLFEPHELTRKYNLAACVQEYLRFKIECESGSCNVDFERERAEHEKAKKEITQLKLRKLRRELHEAADVEEVVGDMLTCFKSKLLSVPSKLAPQLIGVADVTEIMKLLKNEMLEALEGLCEYNAEDYERGDADDGEAEDDGFDDEDMPPEPDAPR